MNKKFITFGLIGTIMLFTAIPSIAASEIVLEVVKECNIQYTGDNCIADLKLINNTNKILDGKAFLSIDYQGVCGSSLFDGEGIAAEFSITNNSWLNFSGWENGTTMVSGFEIAKNETQPKLKINTVSNLCPGKYTFTLKLKGVTDTGEPYIVETGIGGGGGGWIAPTVEPIILEETVLATNINEHSVVIEWDTSYFSTSRVVFSSYSESHDFDLSDNTDNPPLYGYAHTTQEQDSPAVSNGVVNHSVEITGLEEGTTYYFRCISHASPDSISQEHSFTTLGVAGEVIEDEDIVVDDQKDTETTSEVEEVIGEVDEYTTSEQEALEDEIGDREDIINQIEEKIDDAKESGTEIGERMLASLGMIGEKIVSSWFLKILLIILLIFLIYLFLKKRKRDDN